MKEQSSTVKVFGLEGLHENTHIKFTNDGIILSVGLAVEEHISRILLFNQMVTGFTGKVYKSEQRFMYRYYQEISSKFICSKVVLLEQNNLLKKLQVDINTAKSMYYASKAFQLKKQLKIDL